MSEMPEQPTSLTTGKPYIIVLPIEQVKQAWSEAEFIEVDDPNGAQYGKVRLPFSQWTRMLRTLELLGVLVVP